MFDEKCKYDLRDRKRLKRASDSRTDFLRMKEITGKISLATVYNNLSFLHQQGLIRKLTLGDGPERYDRPVRHDHMICRECGRLSDITLQDMTKEIEESTGVCIESYDLKIYYICEECRKK